MSDTKIKISIKIVYKKFIVIFNTKQMRKVKKYLLVKIAALLF